MTAPRVVLDTNVLLVSVSARSPHHWAFRALVDRRATLCLSTEIALEYEEVLAAHMGRAAADDVMEFFEVAPNIEWVRSAYRWQLVTADPDDDKFADCAVAAGATVVSEDRHFDPVRNLDFPPLRVVGIEGFRRLLDEGEGG